jgi:hypothetical protein
MYVTGLMHRARERKWSKPERLLGFLLLISKEEEGELNVVPVTCTRAARGSWRVATDRSASDSVEYGRLLVNIVKVVWEAISLPG